MENGPIIDDLPPANTKMWILIDFPKFSIGYVKLSEIAGNGQDTTWQQDAIGIALNVMSPSEELVFPK